MPLVSLNNSYRPCKVISFYLKVEIGSIFGESDFFLFIFCQIDCEDVKPELSFRGSRKVRDWVTLKTSWSRKKVKMGKKSLLGDKKIEREVTGEAC